MVETQYFAATHTWTIKQHNDSLRRLFSHYHFIVDTLSLLEISEGEQRDMDQLLIKKTRIRDHINRVLRS